MISSPDQTPSRSTTTRPLHYNFSNYSSISRAISFIHLTSCKFDWLFWTKRSYRADRNQNLLNYCKLWNSCKLKDGEIGLSFCLNHVNMYYVFCNFKMERYATIKLWCTEFGGIWMNSWKPQSGWSWSIWWARLPVWPLSEFKFLKF